MRTSRFDQVAAFLAAIMLMLMVCVGVMLFFWLMQTDSVAQSLEPAEMRVSFVSNDQLASSANAEFEEPSETETTTLQAPTLSESVQTLEELSVQGDVLSSQVSGASNGHSGLRSGDASDGTDLLSQSNQLGIIPRHERWHLLFQAANSKQYAEQLDAMDIHLGVFGGKQPGLDSLSQISTHPQTQRNLKPETEKRLYFSWAHPSPLARYEQNLLVQAGIQVSGRYTIKLIPQELEKQLALVELEYARSHGVSTVMRIAKTVFRSQKVDGRYQFVVVEQRYRPPI